MTLRTINGCHSVSFNFAQENSFFWEGKEHKPKRKIDVTLNYKKKQRKGAPFRVFLLRNQ